LNFVENYQRLLETVASANFIPVSGHGALTKS